MVQFLTLSFMDIPVQFPTLDQVIISISSGGGGEGRGGSRRGREHFNWLAWHVPQRYCRFSILCLTASPCQCAAITQTRVQLLINRSWNFILLCRVVTELFKFRGSVVHLTRQNIWLFVIQAHTESAMNAPQVFLVTGDDCLCGHIRVFSLLTLGVVVSPALYGADDHRTSNALDGDHKGTGDHSFPRASLRATCAHQLFYWKGKLSQSLWKNSWEKKN